MAKKLDFDSNKHDYEYGHHKNISRGTNDTRPHQLNQEVPGLGETSQGCENMGEGGDGNRQSDLNMSGRYAVLHQNGYFDDDNFSEDGNERDSGEEGVENNQLKPSECECPCHIKMTSDGRLVKEPCIVTYPGNGSVTSSLAVGRGSIGEQSPDNSVHWGRCSSTSSGYSEFMENLFPSEVPSITSSFLSLTPELHFARNVDLQFYYPMTISIHE